MVRVFFFLFFFFFADGFCTSCFLKHQLYECMYSWSYRLPAKNDPAPPLGNFADIVYLKEQSFLHRIRDVCTL